MWISGTSQYAIRAVVYVAREGRDVPARVGPIAEALDLPRNYLSKTLHALVGVGVLTSERGPRGGFQLAIAPDKLTLARVAAAFEDVSTRQCLLGRTQCIGSHPCAAHGRWSAVSDSLMAFFGQTTIADLLGESRAAEARPARRSTAARRPAARTRK